VSDFKSIDINRHRRNGPYTYSADNITYSTMPFVVQFLLMSLVGTYRYFVKISMVVCVSEVEILRYHLPKTLVVAVDVANFLGGDVTGVIVADATGG
jgi:hypothetical protein